MVTKDKQCWTFEVLGPSMIYNGYNCSKYALNFKFPIITPHVTASLHEISYHHITVSPHHHATMSLCHHITTSPHHHVTTLVSHLPCPPCHQTSQSFALPPATKPVSHLTCPSTTTSLHHCMRFPYHHVTASPHHRANHITTSPHHCVTL